MFAPLMEPTTEPSAPRDIRVEIVEGQLSIRDTVKNQTWNIQELSWQ